MPGNRRAACRRRGKEIHVVCSGPGGAGRYGVRREFVVEIGRDAELTCTARPVEFPQTLEVRKLAVTCTEAARAGTRDPGRASPAGMRSPERAAPAPRPR